MDDCIGSDPHSLITTAPPDADTEAVVLGRFLCIAGQYLSDLVRQLDASPILSQVTSQPVNDSLTPSLGDMGAVAPERILKHPHDGRCRHLLKPQADGEIGESIDKVDEVTGEVPRHPGPAILGLVAPWLFGGLHQQPRQVQRVLEREPRQDPVN